MYKLLKIKSIKPENTQLLIRTDIKTNGWFVHFYSKKLDGVGNWIKEESIIKGYYNDEQIEKVLDEIIEWCILK